ncbi:MAG: hypothetical protein K2Y22_14480 [Candidatus Obscuribacterales bacterium]|nr:hypothetical protein [Candidatus Obscuribacterales bacterium]
MPEDVQEFYDDSTGEVFEIRNPLVAEPNPRHSDLAISETQLLTLYFMAPLEDMLHRSRI